MALLKDEFKKYDVKTFKDYVNEIVSPIEYSYGLNDNLNDSKIVKDDYGIYTFFTLNKKYYVVYINHEGYFGFGISKEYSVNIEDYTDDSESFSKNKNNGYKIFNIVFYILIELINDFKLKEYWFEPSNEKLKKIYEKMTKNTKFQKQLDDLGYEIKPFKNSYFIKRK